VTGDRLDENAHGREAPLVITPRAVVDLARRIVALARERRRGPTRRRNG
jgi:hypothetical protein